MGGNPLETKVEVAKAEEVVAAAAGIPTPPPKSAGLMARLWHYRKLALIVGGSGIALGGGGYGYKYFTASPSKVNAQTEVAVTTLKADEPKPLPSFDDKLPMLLPVVTPVKGEAPAPSDIKVPDLKIPDIMPPTPGAGTTDAPPIVLPPMGVVDTKKPVKVEEPPLLITPPDIALPTSDKKKAATTGDTFKATEPLTTDKKKTELPTGPAPLPSDVTEKKEKTGTGPVIRIGGTEPMPPVAPPAIDIPAPPKTEVPAVPVPGASPAKKDEPPAPPPIPMIDVVLPPLTAPDKKTEPALPTVTVPGPMKGDPPVIVPGVKDVPTIKLPDVKTPDLPPIPVGDPPAKPAVSADPPTIPTLTIPDPVSPPMGVAAPVKKDNYEEDWHSFKQGDNMSLICQEYYHDAKYAAALEAYNKDRGKTGIVRVPPPWVLEDQFAHLIKAGEKTDKSERTSPPDRSSPPEAKTTSGLRFEPAAPIPSGSRPAPPPAETPKVVDEYRVTAPGGETIREVAKKSLGDANAWRKLMDLNPGIDPTLPIPAGTTLRLPR